MNSGLYTKLLSFCKKPDYYKRIPLGLLICNFIFQRILRQNASVPYSIHYTNKIQGAANMKMSDIAKFSLAVSGGCYFTAFSGTTLTVGEDTIFAPNVAIQTANHGLIDRNVQHKGNVNIGNNCWLGFGVVILPNVTLGDNVTVGANSVVTKSFPDNVVLAGCPAKIIKKVVCAE